jgi:thiol:disulfide interchange protein DsbD
MRVFRLLWACLLTLATVGAQAKTPVPIHFTASVSPSPAHPGEVVTVTIHATVAPGWHVYSVIPTPDGPAATEIVSAGNDWQSAGPTTEDAPIRQLDPNFGKEVGFHEGQATFTRQFRVPVSAKTTPASFPGF